MADKEGFPNIKKLFNAIAYAEQIHVGNHFRELGGDTSTLATGAVFGISKTVENPRVATEGELRNIVQ